MVELYSLCPNTLTVEKPIKLSLIKCIKLAFWSLISFSRIASFPPINIAPTNGSNANTIPDKVNNGL